MSTSEKIQADLKGLYTSLEKLTGEREAIDTKIRETRAKASELESALRIIKRYEGNSDSTDLGSKPSAEAGTVEQMLAWALATFPGERISTLVREAEKRYHVEINVKSAGNALWYIKKRGEARREGQRWYPVKKEEAPSLSGGAS